ncbi:class I SAM-dependent methyltransferase [Yoonia sp.]|uniref:class I SAM-dependent methyltransferase n=1 Tax=Yoonia sp. TaxID=2212373 RepID=UPI002FD9239A
MAGVRDQYEAFPYPARDPRDETKRLITGSPSFPAEMDHHLWAGQRDWSQELRVLVAGGGTGDGLVQLAQRMHGAHRPYRITYIDLSTASRKVAEARVAARKLPDVTFHTGSLLDVPLLGTFDYIDCCGVLHHLPDSDAGLRALGAALAPDGGLGFMVYAPYGRSGVYPLQAAFNRLYGHLPPKSMLKHAKATMKAVPASHPLNRNPVVGDHKQSDAGFYDLLLHSQDRAYTIGQWSEALGRTGWHLAGMAQPGLYDLAGLAEPPEGMDPIARMTTAEELRGFIKSHVGYARRDTGPTVDDIPLRDRIPHLANIASGALAKAVATRSLRNITVGPEKFPVALPPEAASLIAGIDGKTTLGQIIARESAGEDRALRLWTKIETALLPWGMMHYSRWLVD